MNPLILHIDQIDEADQPWAADLTREFLDEVLAAPPASEYRADGAARVAANLTKMGREVLVRGRATVPLTGECKRCLKQVHVDEPVEFTLTFVPTEPEAVPKSKKAKAKGKPKAKEDDAPATLEELDQLDQERYSGKEIDLGRPLREQVLLNLPPSPLCKDDCKGLCIVCGIDLNERDCGHSQRVANPALQALKHIQLDKKE